MNDREEFGNQIMAAMEMTADLRAMAVGQRDALIKEGFSPTAAEQMAQALWMASLGFGGGAGNE